MSKSAEHHESLTTPRQEYARGVNARVYTITPEEKTRFPDADLVREDKSRDPTWASRFYLAMSIAGLFYPDNIVEVVGYETTPQYAGLDSIEAIREYMERFPVLDITRDPFGGVHSRGKKPTPEEALPIATHRVYSKKAPIPDDHAVFSKHITVNPPGHPGIKESLCTCEACTRHRSYHNEQPDYNLPAIPGITLRGNPVDTTDFCYSSSNIIFFELSGFYAKDVKEYLMSQNELTANDLLALKKLKEYEELKEIAEEADRKWLAGYMPIIG